MLRKVSLLEKRRSMRLNRPCATTRLTVSYQLLFFSIKIFSSYRLLLISFNNANSLSFFSLADDCCQPVSASEQRARDRGGLRYRHLTVNR